MIRQIMLPLHPLVCFDRTWASTVLYITDGRLGQVFSIRAIAAVIAARPDSGQFVMRQLWCQMRVLCSIRDLTKSS